jgi:hypothetical protein
VTARNVADAAVTVRLPAEPPELTAPAARVLLAILVALTEVEALDGPRGWGAG